MSIDALEKPAPAEVAREKMEVDIACVGFGPAMGGFLTTLTRAWTENPGDPAFESKVTPGIPLQVLCCSWYQRSRTNAQRNFLTTVLQLALCWESSPIFL